MKVTKKVLAERIASRTDTTPRTAAAMIEALMAETAAALRAGDPVQLMGFGAFKTVEVPERAGRNPATGAPITIAAHRRVKFDPSDALLGER